jgi:hypothetical protein
VGFFGKGTFTHSGGTNAGGKLYLGYYDGSSGTYALTGGLLDVRSGSIHAGYKGVGVLDAVGGSVLAATLRMTRGRVSVGTAARVTVGGVELTDSDSSLTTLGFEITGNDSAFVSGAGGSSSPATIGAAGDHTLDLQTGIWRPREGDAFYVLTGFGSITGAFDYVTTNITLGQQTDPNGLPLPFFATGVVTDPNDSTKVAFQVAFQGLTAGDANGDHTVNGGDLSLIGGSWKKDGQTWATCDFDGDGKVNGGDVALMSGNWRWSLPVTPYPQGAPLPEPASAGLLLGAGLGLTGARRRHRRPVR